MTAPAPAPANGRDGRDGRDGRTAGPHPGPALGGASGPERPERVIALVRLAGLPVLALAEGLVDGPRDGGAAFAVLYATAVVWAVACTLIAMLPRDRALPLASVAAIDAILIGALVLATGGASSELRYAFFLVPLGTAVLAGPRGTAVAGVATLLLAVVVDLLASEQPADRAEAVQWLFLGWVGLACTLLSGLLERRTLQVRGLAAERGRLVAGTLEAEDRERARLAEALHDETIQSLLAARQEAARNPSDLAFVRAGLDRAIAQLRDEVFDLQPYLLRQAGLAAALQAVAKRHAERPGAAQWRVAVDPETQGAGPSQELLFHLARELMANAAQHAQAGRVDVTVAREGATVVLDVADDGIGVDPDRARDAPSRGHIGLASSAERAEALGGRLEIASAPGAGTRVTVFLPRSVTPQP